MKRASALALLALGACRLSDDDESVPGNAPRPGAQPLFPAALAAVAHPPPISGGTLAVAPDGRTAVAADSDRDAVYVVDVPSRTVRHTVRLEPGAEPGRVAIDTHGTAHVALRGKASLASIDLASGALVVRPACVAPRGVAFDDAIDAIHVACAEGVLFTLPLAGGAPHRVGLDRDLRDVLVVNGELLVSHFRRADVLALTRDGAIARTVATHGGNLGWRIARANDGVAMISQEPVNPSTGGRYGSGADDACSAPTITTTRLDLPGGGRVLVPPAVLPVDLATNGREYAIVAAGNGHTPSLPQIFVHRVSTSAAASPPLAEGPSRNRDCAAMAKGFVPGQAVAAAFDGEDELLVQSREPAAIYVMSPDRERVFKEIPLGGASVEDTGHAIFHSNSGGFIACASCHAEGGEDGRTWTFDGAHRRTPSMLGTVAATAPYHWDGAIADLRQLVDQVFVTRMSGPRIDDREVDHLRGWLFALPPPPKVSRPADAVDRGAALFRDRGCGSCHAGAAFTDNEAHDVGTGRAFQVPSLVGVGWRAPFLHDGCARKLADRFDGSCGGARHGDVAGLERDQLADLTAFLETL